MIDQLFLKVSESSILSYYYGFFLPKLTRFAMCMSWHLQKTLSHVLLFLDKSFVHIITWIPILIEHDICMYLQNLQCYLVESDDILYHRVYNGVGIQNMKTIWNGDNLTSLSRQFSTELTQWILLIWDTKARGWVQPMFEVEVLVCISNWRAPNKCTSSCEFS